MDHLLVYTYVLVFSFVLLVLVAFALLVFFYPCFMRVGGLINNIRGWALECVCIYIG